MAAKSSILPQIDDIEKIPGADFDIVCKKSDDAIFKGHLFHLWMTCDYVRDVLAIDPTCRSIALNLSVDEVKEAMRYIYNLCRIFTPHRPEIGNGYETRIPIRLYKVFRTLQVERLCEIDSYSSSTKATFLMFDTKQNGMVNRIRGVIPRCVAWIENQQSNCPDPDLASAIATKCINEIAYLLIEHIENCTVMLVERWICEDHIKILTRLDIDSLEKVIVKSYDHLQDDRRKWSGDRFVWWFMMIEYYLKKNNLKDDSYYRLVNLLPWTLFMNVTHPVIALSSYRREKYPELNNFRAAVKHDLLTGAIRMSNMVCCKSFVCEVESGKSIKIFMKSVDPTFNYDAVVFEGEECEEIMKASELYPGMIPIHPKSSS